MPLFKQGHKSPNEVVKNLKSAILIVSQQNVPSKRIDKANDDVSKNLLTMKHMVCGNDGHEPQAELVAQLSQEVFNNEIFELVLKALPSIDFEGKKDFCQIFQNLLRRQIGTRLPTVDHVCARSKLLHMLIDGYENPEIALCCGIMLRECIRYDSLASIVLNSEDFFKFFEYVEMSTFDIASDAFATFKDLLTRHKVNCATFLDENYDRVFQCYTQLLASENYVTRRQSLKLLGELLLDRHNYTIMTKYISKSDNLKLMMNFLKDHSRNIQFEAFHVFKVFVANPNKEPAIHDILYKNQEKLVSFLTQFHQDRTEDDQFNEEKAYLIKQIQALKER